MANNEFTRAGGVWTSGTGLLAAELADIDAKTVRSVSGEGGAYALVDDLVIGASLSGLKIEFGVPLELDDNLVVHGSSYFYGDLLGMGNVYLGSGGIVDINGVATFSDDVFFSGGGVTFDHSVFFNHDVTLGDGSSDDIIVNGAFDCMAVAAFRDTVEFDEEITCNGGASINGPLGVAERLSLSGPLRCFDGGYIKRRLTRITTTLTGVDVSPLTTDLVLVASSYSGGGILLVDVTDVEDGAFIVAVSQSETPMVVTVGTVSAVLCAIAGSSSGSPWVKRAEFTQTGGAWIRFDATEA